MLEAQEALRRHIISHGESFISATLNGTTILLNAAPKIVIILLHTFHRLYTIKDYDSHTNSSLPPLLVTHAIHAST